MAGQTYEAPGNIWRLPFLIAQSDVLSPKRSVAQADVQAFGHDMSDLIFRTIPSKVRSAGPGFLCRTCFLITLF
jgi:hypothetical protein